MQLPLPIFRHVTTLSAQSCRCGLVKCRIRACTERRVVRPLSETAGSPENLSGRTTGKCLCPPIRFGCPARRTSHSGFAQMPQQSSLNQPTPQQQQTKTKCTNDGTHVNSRGEPVKLPSGLLGGSAGRNGAMP
jgi:hypothetical protein